jgi:predicted aspartyl protease
MKTQLKISNKDIEVVIDSGAAISVITEKLREELKLKIIGKSNITCTLANGGKIASLGKINTEIEIYEKIVIPITLDVIESNQREIIIGNDLLNEWNANINYKDKMLELEDEEEIISIPVWYIRQIEESDESEESEYESESEKSEYEQESKRKLYTMKEIIREEELNKKSESSSEESSSDYSDSESSSESENEKDV